MQNVEFNNTQYDLGDYLDHVVSEGIYGELKTGSGASEAWQTITPEEIVEKSTTIRENICINQFHVGGAISRQLEIRLVGNSWSLGVGDIYMYYQYNLDDGGTGTVALGDFIIDMQSIKRTQSYTEFQGYDYFARADKVITQDEITAFENSSNKTLLSLVGYAAYKCGLLFPSGSSFYNIISGHYNNTAKPNMSGGSTAPYSLQRAVNAQATWRDVLSSAAALVGCALKIGRTRVAQGQYNEKKGNVIYGVPFYTTIKDDSSFSYIIGQYQDQGRSPGVHTISINTSTFVSKIDRPCEYHFVFVYHNSNWYLFNGWEPDWDNVVSLTEYGITIQSGTPLESDLIDIMPPIMRTPLYTFDENNSIKREISETSNIVMSVSYSDASFLPGSAEALSQFLSLDLGDNILLPETQGASTMQMIIEATKKNSTSSTARGTGIRADTGTNGDAGALQLYNADITWFGDPRLEAGDFVTSKHNWQTINNDVSFYIMENVFKPHANCTIRSFAGTTNSIYSSTGYNYGGSTGGANSGSTELAIEITQINQRLAGTSFVVTTSAEYEEMAQHGSKTFYILSDTDELYFGDDPIGSGAAIAEALRETNNQKEMRVWIGTTAEYKVLEDHDAIVPNTLYIRTDETLHPEVFEQMVKDEVLTAMALYEEGGGHIGGDLDQGFISILREINHNKGLRMWVGTTAEYQNLVNSEQVLPNVLYIKTDDNSEEIVAEIRAMAEGLKFLGIVDPTKTLPEILSEYRTTLIQGGYISYKLTIVSNTSIYPEIVPVSTTTSNGALVTVAYSAGLTYFTFYYNGNIYIKALYPASGAPDGYSGTNWIKLADGTDSGWKTLAVSGTGFSAGSQTPQYRKIGSCVYVRGQIVVDMDQVSDLTTVFATLPSGYRPSAAKYQLLAGEGDRMARLYVRTGGGININYFKEYAGSAVTGSHWLQLDCEFLTD